MCLFIVPVVGAWSDRLKSSFGRRRPIILLYSIGLVLAMILLCIAEGLVTEPKFKYYGWVNTI